MFRLREKIKTDLFEYMELCIALSDYGNIRGKIRRLLANGEIIRIKKGIYTFPEVLRRTPLSPCVIANMLYGPSYVSCDYALARYGMIPETVLVLTSMTSGRSKEFASPSGRFQYFQNRSLDYSVGVVMDETPQGCFMIASKEKAVYDKALTDRRFTGRDIESYLCDDLRIDHDEFSSMDRDILKSLHSFADGRMLKLVEYLERQLG